MGCVSLLLSCLLVDSLCMSFELNNSSNNYQHLLTWQCLQVIMRLQILKLLEPFKLSCLMGNLCLWLSVYQILVASDAITARWIVIVDCGSPTKGWHFICHGTDHHWKLFVRHAERLQPDPFHEITVEQMLWVLNYLFWVLTELGPKTDSYWGTSVSAFLITITPYVCHLHIPVLKCWESMFSLNMCWHKTIKTEQAYVHLSESYKWALLGLNLTV